MNEINPIAMYWWEGYYGFKNFFSRLRNGQSGYVKNFGDLLSPLIISLLSKKPLQHTTSSQKLLGIGSIFFALKNSDLVWGSGFLNAQHIRFSLECHEVSYLAVRGPETQQLLSKNNIACPKIYGDPALLFPLLVRNPFKKKYRVGIVPHFSQFQYFCTAIKKDAQIHIIDVEKPILQVIQQILSCEIILSTSLHGIIFSEAYEIPALMLTVGKPLHGDLFKFEDYFHSTDRSISFVDFNKMSSIENLTDIASKQTKPKINLQPLVNAFPYLDSSVQLSKNPIISWNDLNSNQMHFKHSLIPPRFRIST